MTSTIDTHVEDEKRRDGDGEDSAAGFPDAVTVAEGATLPPTSAKH